MIAAVIDVGTNTIKMATAEKTTDDVRVISHTSITARIGQGVDAEGLISPEAAARAVDAISKLVKLAREDGVDAIRIVGTSALRDAANGDDIARMVREEVGVELEILSEEDESRFSYLAVTRDPVLGNCEEKTLVFDIGGGSTEFTFGRGESIICGTSVKIGAVRLTERFIKSDPPSREEIAAASSCAQDMLTPVLSGLEQVRLIGVGGSVINMARVNTGCDVERTEDILGSLMTRSDVTRITTMLCALPLNERKQLPGIDPDRADIIPTGAIIVDTIMSITNAPELYVSIRGLRHGLLWEMLG
ncbi:MAG: Ppx/GppA phosphatase family protein [Armatimonadota bacterium]|nr:Ppx/GppA family phosphatase [bacterium]